MTSNKHLIRSAALLFMLALFVGACGSDDNADTGKTDSDVGEENNDTAGSGGDGEQTELSPPPSRDALSCGALRAAFDSERPEETCPAPPHGEPTCTRDSDCGDSEICQEHLADGSRVCSCLPVHCWSDDDCGADEACSCEGVPVKPDDEPGSQRWCQGETCFPTCVPTDCRQDSDCDADQVCGEVYDGCNTIVGYACWDAELSECGSHLDCAGAAHCAPSDAPGQWECGEADTVSCD